MQLYLYLITSVLLAVCASLLISVRSLLAEQSLRTYWLGVAILAGTVSTSVVVVMLVQNDTLSANLPLALMVLVSVLLVAQSWIVRQSLLYMKNIHSVNGVSIIDPLTGVYNRFYLEQRLDAEIARSHRYNTPLAVISAEVSDFKLFKDEFGQQVGDIAVQRLAEQFVSMLRETDVVVRYANGQFVLMLPDTPEGSTQSLLERIEDAVCGLVIVAGAGVESSIRIKVHFGLAHCLIDTQNAAELIEEAFRSLETGSRVTRCADIVETIGVA